MKGRPGIHFKEQNIYKFLLGMVKYVKLNTIGLSFLNRLVNNYINYISKSGQRKIKKPVTKT